MTAATLPEPLGGYRNLAPAPEPVAQVDAQPRDLRGGDVLVLTTGAAKINAISGIPSGAWRITAVRAGRDPADPEAWITLTPGPVDRLTVLRRVGKRSCPVCGRTQTLTGSGVLPAHMHVFGGDCVGAGLSPDEGLEATR